MPPLIQPTQQALSREISRFLKLGRDGYLDVVGKSRQGKTYFVVVDDSYLDMKALWYGACEPKPVPTPNSVTIAPILERMGFEIFHGSPQTANAIVSVEFHRRVESIHWTRNRRLADERKRMANNCCEACGLDGSKKYPKIEGSVLEAHHLTPFSDQKGTSVVVTIGEVRAICSNCHRMIHSLARTLGKNPDFDYFRSLIMS